MAIIACTWFWGNKYSDKYVKRLADGLRRYLYLPHQFRVFTPWPEDMYLTNVPGCFVRLRMFSREWQEKNGINPGDQVINFDLDSIVTRKLDMLFNRPEPLIILGGANSSNPCPYNGSVFMLRAGGLFDVWDDFSLDAVQRIKYYEFPDDQGWLWHKFGDHLATWRAGSSSGIYAFRKPGWPRSGDYLPVDAKLVVFPGNQDPSRYAYLPWVKKNWVDLA